MFIGHYGVALAAKKYEPRLSLGLLFLAVQTLDLLFMSFVLLNIEHTRIVPGFTEYNPYDLYFMPYSHSLVGSLLWSVIAAAAFYLFWARRQGFGLKAAMLLGLTVFSHYLLDLPMHVHDMPVLMSDTSTKLGLGLWNHLWWSLTAEAVCFFVGVYIFTKATQAISRRGQIVTWAVLLFMTALLLATPFMPPPGSPAEFAGQALFGYVLLAVLGEWLGRVREPISK